MYVLLVYDMGQTRVGKMHKLCRRYLNWIQNSVFEGEITEVGLRELLAHANKFLKKDEDSVLIFKARAQKWLEKEVIGREPNPLDTFL